MRYALLLLLCLSFTALPAQNSAKWDLGIEYQLYPTGMMPGIRVERALALHHGVHLRLGYDALRHGDNGVQGNEHGGGFGGTLGYRYYFNTSRSGWFAGARADVWFNAVHWEDRVSPETGTSHIVVFQPTAEAGYLFAPGGGHWFVAPALAFGAEINVKTKGRDVGQGSILLLGVSVGRRLP